MFDKKIHELDKAHVQEVLQWCDKHNINKEDVIDFTIAFYYDCTKDIRLSRHCSLAYQYVVLTKDDKSWDFLNNGFSISYE
jgi:hypothetical protein